MSDTNNLPRILARLESIGNSRDLAQFESEFHAGQSDPFDDMNVDEGARSVVERALADQERQVRAREDEGNNHSWKDRLRAMAEALSGATTKGSGVSVKQRIVGGKRVPLKGTGFDLPSSGSGDSDANDPFRAALSDFVETFVRPNLSEGYLTPGKRSGQSPRLLSGSELVDKEGVVPPDAADKGLSAMLQSLAETGAMGPDELDAFGKEHNLSKAALSRARGAARKRMQGSPEATARKEAAKAANKVVGAAIKAAKQSVAQSLDPERVARLNELREKFRAPEPEPGGETADKDAEKAARQKVRDENRQHRDETWYYRDQQRAEDAQHRDETSDVRAKRRTKDTAEAKLAREDKKHAADHARSEAAAKKEQAKKDALADADVARMAKARETEDQALRNQNADKLTESAGGGTSGKNGKKGGASFDLYKGALLLGAITSATRSGMQVGNVVGEVAGGLDRAVLGAASGFVHAGESALGLFLSPFGKSGAALTKAGGGIGASLLGGLSGLLGAGTGVLKLGAGLAGGAVGLGGAGIGAVLGGVIGGTLTGGAGALPGAVAGAGVMAALGGLFASFLTTIGGAVGQFLGALGEAFGKVGGAIGDTLLGVKDLLEDLIGSAGRLAQATLSVSRGGNLSLGASAGLVSLSSLLTGSPDGLSGAFTGFGHFSQYQGTRLRAFGVAGATGTDPLADIGAASKAYAGMDPIRRALLVQGGFGGNAAIGNLLALGALPGGQAVVQRTLATARDTGITPGETIQNAKLTLDLAGNQAQFDRLKSKFLGDLMPAIQNGLNVFGKWFSANEGKIISGLESVGQWFATKFPGYLRLGINAVFEFGKAFAAQLPAIAEFGKSLYGTLVSIVNAMKPLLEGAVKIGTMLHLIPYKQGKEMYQNLERTKDLDPHGLDGFFGGLAGKSGKLGEVIQGAQDRTNKFLDGAGVKNMDAKAFHQYLQNSSGPQKVQVEIKGEWHHSHDIDVERLRSTTTSHLAAQEIRILQRSGA